MLKMKAKRSVAAVLVALLGACASQDDDSATSERVGEPSLPQAGPAAEAAGATATRASLQASADALLAALQTGGAVSLASAARITEDGRDVPLEKSRLAGARSYTYRTFLAEPATGQASVFGVADVGALPIEFALRFKAAPGGALSEIEVITVRAGEFVLAAPAALTTAHPMYETSVPAAQQQTREQLLAVAGSYFDGIEAASGENVPFDDGCDRIENGVQTTRNPAQHPVMALPCKQSLGTLGYIERVRDRRFPLVDVERGLVLALSLFDVPGGEYVAQLPSQPIPLTFSANTWHVAAVFKIVEGKIQRVEAVLRFAPLGTPSAWTADGLVATPPVI